jgi:YihY family inner membrane protein
MPGKIEKIISRVWSSYYLAINKFFEIDGAQRAGAFAFYAFFALFPLVVILVTVASVFIDKGQAEENVISYIESYIPISGEMQRYIFDTVSGVVEARGEAGVVATLMLVWAARQFFTTLIFAANRAWGTEMYNWWQLPLKSLLLLGIMIGVVFVGIAMPRFARMAQEWLLPLQEFHFTYALWNFFIALFVVFLSLSLFYKLAPRRLTRFSEVWAAALCSTVLLRTGESLFGVYLERFATLNAVYGAFGGIMALLLWIYLSGVIIIFGACLCAAQAKTLKDQS